MTSKLFALLVSFCLLTSYPILHAQTLGNFDYPYVENFGTASEKFLGLPNGNEGVDLIPNGTDLYDGDQVNTIHYGMIPSGSSTKPVLVFVHGYASNATVFFEGDDNLYNDVYNDGYRSAFVSTTPNRHMWTNGNMLANAIKRIKQHYGVSKVVLVGWSKGGVDCDAAISHFGAHSDVSQVFTLSSPHNGTAIAELANSMLLTFVNIIFMQDNDATRSLTRGYMNYFRYVTDNDPQNTVPFTTLGGWGNGPLARVAIPQAYLHLNGGAKKDGGNDGVVPYQSSVRPGSRELFSGQRRVYYWWGGYYHTGPSQTDKDHFEVTRGLVWPYIRDVLNGKSQQPSAAKGSNPNTVVSSNLQIITAGQGKEEFSISPDAEKVQVILGQASASDISVYNTQGQALDLSQAKTQQAEGLQETVLELYFPESGKYTLESSKPYVAMILEEGGVEAVLHTGLDAKKVVYQAGEPVELEVELNAPKEQTIDLASTKATLLLNKSMNLDFTAAEMTPKVFQFEQKGDHLKVQLENGLEPGIYELLIQVEGQDFKRTISHTVAVAGKKQAAQAPATTQLPVISQIQAFPNPFTEQLTIKIEQPAANSELRIYDPLGRLVDRLPVNNETETAVVEWNVADKGLSNGLYILQLGEGENQQTTTVVLQR